MPKKQAESLRNAATRAKILARVPQQPNTIKTTSFDSLEWKTLAEGPEGEYWIKARGTVQELVRGGDVDNPLRTTAFENLTPESVRDLFFSLVTDEQMLDIETKFYSKFGPMVAVDYDKWAHKVHSLWKTTTWNPDTGLLAESAKEVTAEIAEALTKLTGVNKINPLQLEEAYDKVTKNKNSGWPFFTKKWSDDPVMIAYYKEKADLLLKGVDTLTGCPHILFKRTQADGLVNTPKMRAVECPPKHDAIASKALTDKFIDVFKTMTTYFGFNGGENVWKTLEPFMGYRYLVEGDFSSFDQNCQELMGTVFETLKPLIPNEYHQYMEVTQRYYQNSKLVTPEGIIEGVNGKINGLNSGDGWTSVIGTIANAIAVKYAMKRMKVDNYLNLAFGDDIAIAAESFDVSVFENSMTELGMECNQSKQNCSEGSEAYFSFLGYYHFRNKWSGGNKGVFPIMRVATGLYYKERWALPIHGSELEKAGTTSTAVRLMGYAMQLNVCKEHINFPQLVEMFRNHEPERMAVDKILSAKAFEMAMRTHRISRDSSIENSAVIKVLMNLEGLETSDNPVKLEFSGPYCDLTQAPITTKNQVEAQLYEIISNSDQESFRWVENASVAMKIAFEEELPKKTIKIDGNYLVVADYQQTYWTQSEEKILVDWMAKGIKPSVQPTKKKKKKKSENSPYQGPSCELTQKPLKEVEGKESSKSNSEREMFRIQGPSCFLGQKPTLEKPESKKAQNAKALEKPKLRTPKEEMQKIQGPCCYIGQKPTAQVTKIKAKPVEKTSWLPQGPCCFLGHKPKETAKVITVEAAKVIAEIVF